MLDYLDRLVTLKNHHGKLLAVIHLNAAIETVLLRCLSMALIPTAFHLILNESGVAKVLLVLRVEIFLMTAAL